MSLSAKLRRAPLRAVTGAFIVNAGLGKLKADEDTAKALHGMASGTYGFLGNVDPKLFVKGVAVSEFLVGGALLAPFVSPVVAGAALTGFSGSLLNLYWQTDGMHAPGDPRPTQQGTAIAKDIWMFGIGVGLMADGLLEPAHNKKLEITATRHGKKAGKQSRKDRKAAKKARSEARQHAIEAAKDASASLSKRAQKKANKALTKAQKKARKAELSKKATKVSDRLAAAADKASSTVSDAVDSYGPTITDRVTATAKTARDTAKDYVDEYGPVVIDKVTTGAKTARDTAKDYVDEYGPVVVDKVTTGAKTARDAAKDYADEYGPVAVDRAKAARDATQAAGAKAKDRIAG